MKSQTTWTKCRFGVHHWRVVLKRNARVVSGAYALLLESQLYGEFTPYVYHCSHCGAAKPYRTNKAPDDRGSEFPSLDATR